MALRTLHRRKAMPLLKGKKNVGANIQELLRAYSKTGKIGSIKPRNVAHAREIAKAIAMRKARER